MFDLTPEQLQKLDDWIVEVNERARAIQLEQGKTNEDLNWALGMTDPYPYYGAIGGGVTYSFTPTSIGVIVQITETITKEELDLTDYDTW